MFYLAGHFERRKNRTVDVPTSLKMNRNGITRAAQLYYDAIERTTFLPKGGERHDLGIQPTPELKNLRSVALQLPNAVIGSEPAIDVAKGGHGVCGAFALPGKLDALLYSRCCLWVHLRDYIERAVLKVQEVHGPRLAEQFREVGHVLRETRHWDRLGRKYIDLESELCPGGH